MGGGHCAVLKMDWRLLIRLVTDGVTCWVPSQQEFGRFLIRHMPGPKSNAKTAPVVEVLPPKCDSR